MLKVTKTLGNCKALAYESRSFVHKKEMCPHEHISVYPSLFIVLV